MKYNQIQNLGQSTMFHKPFGILLVSTKLFPSYNSNFGFTNYKNFLSEDQSIVMDDKYDWEIIGTEEMMLGNNF